jgi:hypothetical protein
MKASSIMPDRFRSLADGKWVLMMMTIYSLRLTLVCTLRAAICLCLRSWARDTSFLSSLLHVGCLSFTCRQLASPMMRSPPQLRPLSAVSRANPEASACLPPHPLHPPHPLASA